VSAPESGPPDTSPSERNAALARLDELTRVLRRECPWDREQDERSIVPHTVEEAYELADAAQHDDDSKLLDELGDVLFQVHFLSLLLEERGAGDLAEVAEHCHAKLVRRHPHVFGEIEVEGAGEVLRNWDRIKQDEAGREPGLFGEVPENLPGPLYARKVQRRAASSGFDWPDARGPLASVREELAEVEEAAGEQSTDRTPRDAAAGRGGRADPARRDALFEEVGDLLFAAVSVARKLRVDPELALRGSANRFRERVERAAALAAHEGAEWAELTPERQIELYSRSR
jgi:MazG family protein